MRGMLSICTAVVFACFFSSAVNAATVTIDFEDAPAAMAVSPGFVGTYESQGYDLVSNYCCWAVIGQPAALNNKAMLFGAWGFDFNLYGDDFTLVSFDVGFLSGSAGTVNIRGYRDGAVVASDVISISANDPLPFYQTINLDSSWQNLDRVHFSMSGVNCCPGDASALDNIVLASARTPVDITVTPLTPDGTVHPQHDGGPAGSGLNDMLDVVVLGSSTLVGDPVDFDASDIDPATLRFGPGEGGVAPDTSPTFGVDFDSDGIDDAKFNILTGDSGIQCSDTDAELTGATSAGEEFSGIDAISTDCDAVCHD